MFAEAVEPPVETAGGTAIAIGTFHNHRQFAPETALENDNDPDSGPASSPEKGKDRRTPPPVFSADPDEDLEQRLKAHPESLDAKVDVGSDESMDASDPLSVVRPGNNDPVPSSSSPKERNERD